MSESLKTTFFGKNENSDINMELGAFMHILKYAKATGADGSRGVLLGKKDVDKTYIFAAVSALYGGSDGLFAPSFTKESWERITNEIKETYPNFQILGQYTVHSGTAPDDDDIIMQSTFFDGKGILFIFDPIANGQEVYRFNGDAPEAVGGMYVFDRYGNEIEKGRLENIFASTNHDIAVRESIIRSLEGRIKSKTRLFAAIILVMLIFCTYLGITANSLAARSKELKKKTNDLQWVLEQHEAQIMDLQTKINELLED